MSDIKVDWDRVEAGDKGELVTNSKSWPVQMACMPAYVRLVDLVTEVTGSMTLSKSQVNARTESVTHGPQTPRYRPDVHGLETE